MKLIRTACLINFVFILGLAKAQDAELTGAQFAVLDVKAPGLEAAGQALKEGRYNDAAARLLNYYRGRNNVRNLHFNMEDRQKYAGKKIPDSTMELANNILQHRFKPHKGYPSYDYGKDINWQYRPVPDQLVSTFLHRTAFWEALGLAYMATGDEKYAEEWIFQVRDWIRKNPPGAYPDDKDFAWKAFVVSFRLNHWSGYFNMFLNSPHFTPQFLMEFLNSYARQADYVMANYTETGNHRLYEALHLMYAGSNFPELKQARQWLGSGIAVLNREIHQQVLPDGMQFELSPSYHIGSIAIFLDALTISRLAGAGNAFPETYSHLVEKMILAVGSFSFPDYTFPLYGNSFLTSKEAMLKNYSQWQKAFPRNKTIRYYASDGKSGLLPPPLSSRLPDAGFYTFRNGWQMQATVMQVKAGPPAFFHSHPDNGNFDLWVKGRNFTPDAGSFIYANVGGHKNEKRDWYRSSRAHQTLTLNNQNINNKAAVSTWRTSDSLDILTYSNPSYPELTHQRSFLFIDKTFFLIIDRAIGDAVGTLGIHFNLEENSRPVFDDKKKAVHTTYTDGNNLLIRYLGGDPIKLAKEESFVSYQYQKEMPRPAFVFEHAKQDGNGRAFISLLLPFQGNQPPVTEMRTNKGHDIEKGIIDVTVKINGKSYMIKELLH